MLLDYLPLSQQEYILIFGTANITAVGHVRRPPGYIQGKAAIVGSAIMFAHVPTASRAEIIGFGEFVIDLRNIYPTVVVSSVKTASINTYILQRHNEVEIESSSTHIEIETRHPEIKVIDID